MSIFEKIFGSRNSRLLRSWRPKVAAINALEPEMQKLSSENIRQKASSLRERAQNGEPLEKMLIESFALTREAARRTLGFRHFDVQLFGGMALAEGKIAEMRTGEGKTLTATLPVLLHALPGKGVHVVTVNDYLARRDAEWMGQVYRFLGMTVGVNIPQVPQAEKKEAYACDITYGTNNEFGFDYLRDNMVYSPEERVQRHLFYAIVDEVDSILIDEARTPLIISGQAEDNTQIYILMDRIARRLERAAKEGEPGDFVVDEKAHQILLTEEGHEKAERLLVEAGLLSPGEGLYDPGHIGLMHYLNAALKAHHLYFRDQHYVVQNGEVVIVDEFTGRLMAGRRWSEGLHQAVEAKEKVPIQQENLTLASITFQNYFRMYEKLSGMTGTAATEAQEFWEIYKLETMTIPTHKPMIRKDEDDLVFRIAREKYQAMTDEIKEAHERGQPVLVGTASIENSELISGMLKKEKLPHEVLNAKHHAREAEIIAQAGRPGAITIATNMAGRGTDIVLGGNIEPQLKALEADESLSSEEKEKRRQALTGEWQKLHVAVVEAGGLFVIGSERHESRRIDNQLRGRSGRQGDPGRSRFFLSLEDPLLRIFASDRIAGIMQRLKMPEGEAIEHPWVTRAIENAQKKVEARNFDIRKQLLEYDDVANEQRRVIYAQRNEILEAQHVAQTVEDIREEVLSEIVAGHIPPGSPEDLWDVEGLQLVLESEFGLALPIRAWLEAEEDLDGDGVKERIVMAARDFYAAKARQVGEAPMRAFERAILLQVLDHFWREHLTALETLRQGIYLRGYAQKDPKQEYKREAFALFGQLLSTVRREVTQVLMKVEVRQPETLAAAEEPHLPREMHFEHALASGPETLMDPEGASSLQQRQEAKVLPFVRGNDKVRRNDPCPCGSGKKYKHCHGKIA